MTGPQIAASWRSWTRRPCRTSRASSCLIGCPPDSTATGCRASTDEPVLVPSSAPRHGTPNGSQDPQDRTDDHQDAADGVQNSQTGEIADYQKNDPKNNHAAPPLLNAV